MNTSPIEKLLGYNVPHIWGKIVDHLDGDSFQAFRSSCFGFYEIAESCLEDNHLSLKDRLHFEMSQFKTTPLHYLPKLINPLSLQTWVTTFAKDGNDVFLGLMTGDSSGGFVYHLDLTTNQCRSRSRRFRGPVINIQCMSDKIAIEYEEKFNLHYDYTDRKYALYGRYPELESIPVKMPYLTCTSKLCVLGDALIFLQSPSKNGGVLVNRLERDNFQPVMEFLGDQDRLPRCTNTQTHVLFSTSETLSMVRFYRNSYQAMWTTTLKTKKAKISMVLLSDELVVVEKVKFSGSTKDYLVVSFHTGDVIREYKHAQLGNWACPNERILKGTFELVTCWKNSKQMSALLDWKTQELIPIPITGMATWDVLGHGIRITFGDGRIWWINRNDLKALKEFYVGQQNEPLLFDTKMQQLSDQSHLALVSCLSLRSGVLIVHKLTKGFLKRCGRGSTVAK